jgi:hypothetical protein
VYVYRQSFSARQQLRGFHISPFSIEEVLAEIIYIADGGGRCKNAILFHFVKKIPFFAKLLEYLLV